MRVLVAGGTGFIGKRVVDALLAKGEHDVLVMTRDPARARPKPGVEYVQGDVTDPASLEGATRDVDAVVHAVQFPNHPVENPRKGWTYERIDGAGTERMAAAAAKNGVKRFVYLSGAGTRPGPDRALVPRQGARRAGRHVQRHGVRHPAPVLDLRPGRPQHEQVRGVREVPAGRAGDRDRAGAGPGGRTSKTSAKVAAAAVDEPAAANRVFELGSQQPLAMDEIIRTIMRILGKRKPLVHQPAWFVKIPAAVIQYVPNAPLSPGAVDFITMDERVDPTEAERCSGSSSGRSKPASASTSRKSPRERPELTAPTSRC